MYVDVLFKLQISISTKLALEGNFHTPSKKTLLIIMLPRRWLIPRPYYNLIINNIILFSIYLEIYTGMYRILFYFHCKYEYNTNIFAHNLYCNKFYYINFV